MTTQVFEEGLPPIHLARRTRRCRRLCVSRLHMPIAVPDRAGYRHVGQALHLFLLRGIERLGITGLAQPGLAIHLVLVG